MSETESICDASFPIFEEKHLVESNFDYPVSFNGKVRFKLSFPTDISSDEIETQLRNNDQTIKYLDGKDIKKVIVVKNRIINVVF